MVINLHNIPGVEQVVAGILLNVILALISAFGTYAVAWLRKNISQKNLSTALSIAKIAVKAAESVGTAYGYDSKAKFEYAMNAARQVGEAHGIKFTDVQWESFIEQAHHELTVLEQELEKGPTVDPNQPAMPEPAGPPGPQTTEGQELTGIGETVTTPVAEPVVEVATEPVVPAVPEPVVETHAEPVVEVDTEPVVEPDSSPLPTDEIPLEDRHAAFLRDERG
jgi:hypothetical protein